MVMFDHCALLELFLVPATAISSRNTSPPARTQVHILQNTWFQIHRMIQTVNFNKHLALIIAKKFFKRTILFSSGAA